INRGDFEDTLINLALNARDAMPNGGTITLATHNRILDDDYCARNPDAKPGEYVELMVSDTGEGMSLEQQQHIFEPFYTMKDTGTGLGLAMVYGFTKRSGGHIKVYSELGVGTTFRFYLPRTDASEQRQQTVDREPETLPRGGLQTLLVVDDEEGLLILAKRQLESLGYRVLVASDAEQALAVLAEEAHIDLLFTDVVMPGMNGFELSERATALRPGLKVLLTSGYEQYAMAQTGETRFIADLLSKPSKIDDLAREVWALVGKASPAA
ncbi:MAG: response regulator, partial [Proteobacteria bacterium]|nr:response regulator [Pseudomonadota bacterium]